MKTVLVTAGDTRVSYNICKALAKHGYRVFSGNRTRYSMTAASKYVNAGMQYSSPFTDEENFLADLEGFIRANNVDILIPVLEETFTVAKNKQRLAACVNFLLPEYEQILAVHDKGRLAGILEQLGVCSPVTVELAALLNNDDTLPELRFPAMLKPKQGGGGWGMHPFARKEELLAFARDQVEFPERCIVQEMVSGQLTGACAIYKDGRFITGDVYKYSRVYPLEVGQSTTRESIANSAALQALKTLLDYLKWNGVCEADFITDSRNGKNYLLDINPRFWGAVAHNIAAGVDYPYYYCLLATNDLSFNTAPAVPGTRTQWLGGELMRMLSELKRADDKLGFLAAAWRSRRPTNAYDDWDIKDPLPFLAWAFNSLRNKLLKRPKDSLPGIWE